MVGLPNQARLPAVMLILVTGMLGGCVTGTEVSYSQYQYDPYDRTERVYEHNVYSDSDAGVRTEACRTTIRRHIDPFGGEFDRRTEVCEETPGGYGGEPLSPGEVPQSVYRNPDHRPLPSAAIPDPG